MKPINSPLRYPGGKSKLAVRQQILAYLPAATQEYREPFVGGGGIFFGLPATQKLKKRWINDVNPDLISVYRAFQDDPAGFIERCRAIEPMQTGEPEVATKGTGKKYNQRLGEQFQKFASDNEMDPALRYFFINRTVWAGRVTYDPKKASRMYYSNPQGWNVVGRPGYLEDVADHLRGARITSTSYEPLLLEDGDDVWVYLDPPYYCDTEFSATDKLYQCGFSEEDHIKLALTCKATKHKICISYDDHPVIRDLYKDFHIYEHSWKYCGSSKAVKDEGKELIITNYEKPGQQMSLDQEYEELDICSNL
jgi:DNA adenine methylase